MTSDYNAKVHHRCVEWTDILTNPKRSLMHKACLCRFLRMIPVLHDQVNVMIAMKLHFEAVSKTIVRNPKITIHVQ